MDDYRTWEGRSPQMGEIPISATLEVPMLYRGELIGVLAIDEIGDTTRKFTEADVRLLSLLASQAAGAVHNARLLEETRQRADEFAALYETMGDLAAAQELSPLLERIVERAMALLNTQQGFAYIFDAVHNDLELTVEKGTGLPRGARLPLGEGMAGRVAQTCQPLLVDDYQTWEGRAAIYANVPMRGVIEVPMMFGGELIGVLGVISELGESTRKFRETDARLLALFAGQAASAVHNTRSLTEAARRASEFAALYETARDLSTKQELSALLPAVVERAASMLNTPGGFAYLYDPQRRHLELVVEKGFTTPPGTRLLLGEGVAGRVAQTHEPLIVDNYGTWENRSPQYDGTQISAVIEVPMLYGGELIGVLGVEEIGVTTRKFTQADARLLSLFAWYTASAIHNARLFEETKQRAEQLELLYDAGLTLNRVLNPRVQLEFLFNIAMKALHAERAEFWRFDPVRGELGFEIGVGYESKTLAEIRGSRFASGEALGLVGWVTTNRQPLNLPDVTVDPRYVAFDPAIRSGLWVPVEHENQPRGVINVLSTRPNAFSSQDERLLVLFANQVAVAMENARLLEETRRRLDQAQALRAIDTAISGSLDVNVTLNVVLEQATSQLGIDAADILLLNPHMQTLDYAVGRGFRSSRAPAHSAPVGRWLCRSSRTRTPHHRHSRSSKQSGWLDAGATLSW